jgi:hypothetical protein
VVRHRYPFEPLSISNSELALGPRVAWSATDTRLSHSQLAIPNPANWGEGSTGTYAITSPPATTPPIPAPSGDLCQLGSPHLGPPHLGPPHPGPTCHPPHTGPLCHPGLPCHRPVPPCAAKVCIGECKVAATAQMRVKLRIVEFASNLLSSFTLNLDLSRAIRLTPSAMVKS